MPGGSIRPKWMLKPWANISSWPGPQVRGDLGVVDGLLGGVGDEDHDHVGGLDRVGDVDDREPGILREGAALRSGREPDDDVDPGLVEVERVGVALAAVADDRHGLPGQRRRIGVVVVVHASRSSLDRLLDGSRAPGHHDGAGADQFLDAVGPDQRDERVDLGLGAGHLDDDRPIGQVHDPAARQLDERRISARFASVARIFTSASSCSTVGSAVTSWTLRTSMSR